ncbi:hypothetical protein [Bosea vaviloviae]|nr:hypothetical protein [Bosea vaviloviae]
MTFHDPRDAQRYRARLKKQREYQRKYRERLVKERAPESADIASACMNAFLAVLIKDPKLMGPLPRIMVNSLVERGFDRELTVGCIRRMADRKFRQIQRMRGE